jgi:hypothetical protein
LAGFAASRAYTFFQLFSDWIEPALPVDQLDGRVLCHDFLLLSPLHLAGQRFAALRMGM